MVVVNDDWLAVCRRWGIVVAVNDDWLAVCRRWGIVVVVNDDWLAVCRRRSIVAGRHQCIGTVHLLRLTSHAVAFWCHSQALTNSSLFMLSNNYWMVRHQHSHIKCCICSQK